MVAVTIGRKYTNWKNELPFSFWFKRMATVSAMTVESGTTNAT